MRSGGAGTVSCWHDVYRNISTISILVANPLTFTADVLPSVNVWETTAAKISVAPCTGPVRTHLNGRLPLPKVLTKGYFRDDWLYVAHPNFCAWWTVMNEMGKGSRIVSFKNCRDRQTDELTSPTSVVMLLLATGKFTFTFNLPVFFLRFTSFRITKL
jgi:hypothetical protein